MSIARSMILISSFSGVVVSAASAQTTWFVDDDACPGPGTGTSVDPFCSIQVAIDAAAAGDVVLVRPGDYAESIDFTGKNIAVRSTDGTAATRIRGSSSGFPNAAIVNFVSGEGATAVVEGFTIGLPTAMLNDQHGVLCDGASPTIRGNVIEHNSNDAPGGGIYCLNGSTAIIDGNWILDNESTPGDGRGGGIACIGASPWIVGNIIERNSVFADPGGYGGGVYLASSAAVVENNLVVTNTVCDQNIGSGGGIAVVPGLGAVPYFVGNTITDNRVCAEGGRGGGLYVGDDVVLEDSILWGNKGGPGRDLYVDIAGPVQLDYCDVDTKRRAIFGSYVLGPGSVSIDPGFVGAGDYHLQPTSPLIDAGSPMRKLGGMDGDLDPRVLDGNADGLDQVDIGWDEFDPAQVVVSGTPAIGQMVTFQTTGVPGWRYVLAVSPRRGDLPLPPYGGILLDVGELYLVGMGAVPGSDSVTLPLSPALAGTTFYLQAFAKDPVASIGSFSRRIDLLIQ